MVYLRKYSVHVKKNVYSVLVGLSILYMSASFAQSIVLFKSAISLLLLYLDNLSIVESDEVSFEDQLCLFFFFL